MLADPRYATITGRGQVTIPGYPVRMSRSPARVAAPPQPGAHTTQVLRDWLSATYQPERITPSPEPSP
jgi:crotonobetainyl-CoA:carnitine CoA-transferase CaiB-like acyl-CoA transferase